VYVFLLFVFVNLNNNNKKKKKKIENLGTDEVEVSLMFTFQNGTEGPTDYEGGHINYPFKRFVAGNNPNSNKK
jgi:hypothetical protein